MVGKMVFALVLTEGIEALTAFMMGYKDRNFYITLFLANLITNPVVNYIIIVLFSLKLLLYPTPVIISLEILVVLAEWMIFSFAAAQKVKRPLLFSLLINTASFAAGFIIQNKV
jgi:hypothetical protein